MMASQSQDIMEGDLPHSFRKPGLSIKAAVKILVSFGPNGQKAGKQWLLY